MPQPPPNPQVDLPLGHFVELWDHRGGRWLTRDGCEICVLLLDAGQRGRELNYTALLPFNADAARNRDEANEKGTAAAAPDERSSAMPSEARRPPEQRSVEVVVEEEEEGGRLLRRPVWPGPTVEASSSAVSAEMKERNTLAQVRCVVEP